MSSRGTATVTAVQAPIVSQGSTSMSTAGAGSVAAVVGVVGGAALLAGAAVVGAGILIGKGVVWCGQKIDENYQNACKEFTNLAERARAENMQNITAMNGYMADQFDYLAFSSVTLDNPQPAVIDTKAMDEAFARVQQALNDANTLVQNRDDTRRKLLVQRLYAEIEAGRGILPEQELKRAEAALHGSSSEMEQAIKHLQEGWSTVTEADSLRKREKRQAQRIIQAVRAQLSAVEAMLQNSKSASRLMLLNQHEAVLNQVRKAEDHLDIHSKAALAEAQVAEQGVRRLMEAISSEMIASMNSRRKEINMLRGMLKSLDTMLQETKTIQLLDAGRVAQLVDRVQKAQAGLDTLEKQAGPAQAQQLARMKARINLLKEDVFATVKTTQQRNFAETITTTLSELGYKASEGNKLTTKRHGDTLHIQAMIDKQPDAEQRDEKIISFDVGPDGAISYDFSGYAGDSCIEDAKRIFTSLRQKGLFILDDRGIERLSRLPAENVTSETLKEAQFEPGIKQNKTQAGLADSLKRVMEKMGYPHIQQRTIGGSIELEAFKGQIGYRVVLSPDGKARVLKDAARVDVSGDARDPVALEARRTIQQLEAAQEEEEEEEEEQMEKQAQSRRPLYAKQQQQARG